MPALFIALYLALLSIRLLIAILAAMSSGRSPPDWFLGYLLFLPFSGIISVLSNPDLVSLKVSHGTLHDRYMTVTRQFPDRYPTSSPSR